MADSRQISRNFYVVRIGAYGRITIPIALRRKLGWRAGTPVELRTKRNGVLQVVRRVPSRHHGRHMPVRR